MELRQLRYFLRIVECGSLSRAATVLGVAQPALSRQLRQLEEELGVALFYRHGRGVRLTEEGAQFRVGIEPVLRELSQVRADLRETAGTLAGDITIGLPPSIATVIGANLVRTFLVHHPQVRLHLVEGLSGYINEWLAAGRVDMAVINSARGSPSIRMDPLLTTDLRLYGRPDDLARVAPDPVTFPTARLSELPLLLVGTNHGMRRQLDASMQRLGLQLSIRAQVDALNSLKTLVGEGFGFTVLPLGVVDAAHDGLAMRMLTDPPLTQTLMLAFSLQRPTTLAMRELARQVRAEIARAIDAGVITGRIDSGGREVATDL